MKDLTFFNSPKDSRGRGIDPGQGGEGEKHKHIPVLEIILMYDFET